MRAAMRPSLLALAALLSTGCASLRDTSLRESQVARIEAWKASQARDFTRRFAQTQVNAATADLQVLVTAEAIEAPLAHLKGRRFVMGSGWTFTPTRAPDIELFTGSATLSLTGDVTRGDDSSRTAEVTLVAGLTLRWAEDGSRIELLPTSLAVLPTLESASLELGFGRLLRSLAEREAQAFFEQRVGKLTVPVELALPVKRQALDLTLPLGAPDESDPPAALHLALPLVETAVQVKRLWVWPLEGRIAVVAFAEVGNGAGAGGGVKP